MGDPARIDGEGWRTGMLFLDAIQRQESRVRGSTLSITDVQFSLHSSLSLDQILIPKSATINPMNDSPAPNANTESNPKRAKEKPMTTGPKVCPEH